MISLTIDPVYIEVGAPALAIGLAIGALIFWLIFRGQRKRLLQQLAQADQSLKSQEALQAEREAAFELTNLKLTQAFASLSNQSLQSNSENFLRLAEQNLGIQQQKARQALGEREQAVENLVRPIREALQKSHDQIAALEKARSEAYGGIKSQLESMQLSQRSLTQETQNLVNALRRPEVRGRWGEITLRRLVELAGMVDHCDFEEQVHTSAEDKVIRPDMIVRMPNNRELVVDVKTPLDAYLEAIEAKDDAQRELGLKRHARNVREHIRKLSGKSYWEQFSQSPEFVILFIPGDQFLSAALEIDPALLEDALARHVILATPSSFVALLRAVAYGWRQEALARNAEEIQAVGQEMYARLSTFSEHLARLGRSLDSSVDAFNKAVGSYDSRVLPGARKFSELGVTGNDKPPGVEQIERATRYVESRCDSSETDSAPQRGKARS